MAGGSLDIKTLLENKDQIASTISGQYDMWVSARRVAEKLWKETRDFLFATDTRGTTNSTNPWDNTTTVPKLAQIRDNLDANYYPALFPNNEWLRFVPGDDAAASLQLRNKIEAYFRNKNELNGFEEVMRAALLDWIDTGNCFVGVEWVTRTTREPLTGEETVEYVGYEPYRISPYDIVFNPLAPSFDKSPIILRRLCTRGEIARIAEESPEQWASDVLAKSDYLRAAAGAASSREVNKYAGLSVDGFGTFSDYLNSGYIEILEFYGDVFYSDECEFRKNRVIRIIDRCWVVTDEESTTWTGRPHIFHSGWRKRPDNLWSQGPLEPLVGMQYRINHLENAKADAYDQQLDPDLVISGNFDILQSGPKKLYISDDAQGRVTRLAPDTTILQANTEIDKLMWLMEEMAGAPREAMGIRTPGEKTAFEVSSLMERSGKVFQNKVRQFEKEIIVPVMTAALELTRTYMSSGDTISTIDEETGIVEFLKIDKAEIRSKGWLKPMGAQHFSEQARAVQTLTQLSQTIMADPEVRQHISSKRMAQIVVDDILNYSKFKLYQPYVRIAEQYEAQALMNTAQEELAVQDQMEADGIGYEDAQLMASADPVQGGAGGPDEGVR